MNRQTQIQELKNKINELQTARKTIIKSLDILESKEREELTYKTVQHLNSLINTYIDERVYFETHKTFYFWFAYQPNGKRHTVTTRTCKRPEMTKEYKELKRNFNCGFIAAYGYDIAE